MIEPRSMRTFIEYCCPRCKGPVVSRDNQYACNVCSACYPIILGIPDFRVFPDPYISFEDDYRKAQKIADTRGDFRAMMDFYWAITPDTPPEMARRFTAVALASAERGRHLLASNAAVNRKLEESSPLRVLDVGSRTGGLLLAAAERSPEIVGIDIAFRWLIVARQRMIEAGRSAQLVCCCAEFLPFRTETFDLIVAENVLEHTVQQQALIEEAHRALKPAGIFFSTTWNRLAAAPEPHVRLWGVGWLPRALARRYVQWARETTYDHVRLVSCFGLRQMVRRSSFVQAEIVLPKFGPTELAGVSPSQRRVVDLYHKVKDWPLIRHFLLVFGPVLHVVCVRKPKAD